MKRTGAVSRLSRLQIGLFPLRRMPRTIGACGIVLRPLEPRDGSALSQLASMNNGPRYLRSSKRWAAYRCWYMLKRVFPLAYAIEKESRVVGFIGLYDIRAGRSAEMSLWIEEGERRRGTGTKAADLLSGASGSAGLVRELIVKIDPDNNASSSFWRQCGFRRVSSNGRYLVMKKATLKLILDYSDEERESGQNLSMC